MKFSEFIKVKLAGGGVITLREPTAKEYNAYKQTAYGLTGKGSARMASVDQRAAFFDELFVSVEGCDDDKGKIPKDGKTRIPPRYKDNIILLHVETIAQIDEKNS